MTTGHRDKTAFRPLTPYTLNALRYLSTNGPQDRLLFNSGCWDRLGAEALVQSVQLPSPHKVDRGGTSQHYEITALGHQRLVELS